METGETVRLAGYDVQARINSLSGHAQVVIVHNNSTHLLVIVCDLIECTDFLEDGTQFPHEGKLVHSLPYHDGDDPYSYDTMFHAALHAAIDEAYGC